MRDDGAREGGRRVNVPLACTWILPLQLSCTDCNVSKRRSVNYIAVAVAVLAVTECGALKWYARHNFWSANSDIAMSVECSAVSAAILVVALTSFCFVSDQDINDVDILPTCIGKSMEHRPLRV